MYDLSSYHFAERIHDYASLFSYASWKKTLKSEAPVDVSSIYRKYDVQYFGEGITYMTYLEWVYRFLLQSYRNEYVYKNELLDKYIVRKFGKTSSVAINEFRVGDNIADIALFNGESKCFEIKSDLDSPQRLCTQLESYKKVFEKCYILIPATSIDEYKELIPEFVGVLLLDYSKRGHVSIHVEKEADRNDQVDVNVLMRSVRASEYRRMVKLAFGSLPDVSDFEMFNACKDMLMELSPSHLHRLFCDVVKMRKTKVCELTGIAPILRQMALSMGVPANSMHVMVKMFNQVIS